MLGQPTLVTSRHCQVGPGSKPAGTDVLSSTSSLVVLLQVTLTKHSRQAIRAVAKTQRFPNCCSPASVSMATGLICWCVLKKLFYVVLRCC